MMSVTAGFSVFDILVLTLHHRLLELDFQFQLLIVHLTIQNQRGIGPARNHLTNASLFKDGLFS